MNLPGKQDGAALIVGLILMVVITILAISGMNTATTELAMARNDQSYENAFQAAETGLEMALSQGRFNTLVNVNLAQTVNTFDSVTAVINFEDTTLVPDRAFSMGVDPGGTDRDASAIHTQAFYVVGPEASSL
jgi:type IV pilus assembly protein PilX